MTHRHRSKGGRHLDHLAGFVVPHLGEEVVPVVLLRHRQQIRAELDDGVLGHVLLLLLLFGDELVRGEDEDAREHQEHGLEVGHRLIPGDDHRGAHRHRAADAVAQHLLLLLHGHLEVVEDEHEHEQVVHRQTLLQQVPGEILLRFPRAHRRADAEAEQRRRADPQRDFSHGAFALARLLDRLGRGFQRGLRVGLVEGPAEGSHGTHTRGPSRVCVRAEGAPLALHRRALPFGALDAGDHRASPGARDRGGASAAGAAVDAHPEAAPEADVLHARRRHRGHLRAGRARSGRTRNTRTGRPRRGALASRRLSRARAPLRATALLRRGRSARDTPWRESRLRAVSR